MQQSCNFELYHQGLMLVILWHSNANRIHFSTRKSFSKSHSSFPQSDDEILNSASHRGRCLCSRHKQKPFTNYRARSVMRENAKRDMIRICNAAAVVNNMKHYLCHHVERECENVCTLNLTHRIAKFLQLLQISAASKSNLFSAHSRSFGP